MGRRRRPRLAIAVAALLVAAAAAIARSDLPRDPALYPPASGSRTIAVFVVSNGFHTGLALPAPELARVAGQTGKTVLIALTQRFGSYDFLEFGWGEERFYRGTPNFESLKWRLAFRALFLKNRTVVQVVGLAQPPPISFRGATLARIGVTEQGFERLAGRLEATFTPGPAGGPLAVGPGLYGPSLFFRANGRSSVFNVCNNWVGWLLNAAGLANAPVLTTTANGLLADLQFRSGVQATR